MASADDIYQWTNILPRVLWPSPLYSLDLHLWKTIASYFDVETFKAVRLVSRRFLNIASSENERFREGMLEGASWVDPEELRDGFWGGNVYVHIVGEKAGKDKHPLFEGLTIEKRLLSYPSPESAEEVHQPQTVSKDLVSKSSYYSMYEKLVRPFVCPAVIEGFRGASLDVVLREGKVHVGAKFGVKHKEAGWGFMGTEMWKTFVDGDKKEACRFKEGEGIYLSNFCEKQERDEVFSVRLMAPGNYVFFLAFANPLMFGRYLSVNSAVELTIEPSETWKSISLTKIVQNGKRCEFLFDHDENVENFEFFSILIDYGSKRKAMNAHKVEMLSIERIAPGKTRFLGSAEMIDVGLGFKVTLVGAFMRPDEGYVLAELYYQEEEEATAGEGSKEKPDNIAVGDKCKVNWKGKGKFYGAKIRSVNSDGTFNIDFDDSDKGNLSLLLLVYRHVLIPASFP